MKKTFALAVALSLILTLLAGCASEPEETKISAAEEVILTPEPTEKPEPTPEPEPEKTETPAEETEELSSEQYETALSLVGHDVIELIEAIGEPDSMDEYSVSCAADNAEDGLWYYSDCYVFTIRFADGSEEVTTVIEAVQ